MRFCKHVRNISLHRYPLGIATVTGTKAFDLGKTALIILEDGRKYVRIPFHTLESKQSENQTSKGYTTQSFFVKDLPKWFNETPDVMYILNCYLKELESFVVEVEKEIEMVSNHD